jgi:Zn-dependent M28 family amino/carboxypeptidase
MKQIAVLISVTYLFATEWSPGGRAWWSHIQFLASDALEGRRAGSAGHTKAAEYVAAKFREAGLKPGGGSGAFIQSVPMETRILNEADSTLELVSTGKVRKLRLGEEANLGIRIDKPGMVDAEVVFVGHGLKIPEAGIDDLAGINLKGKIAIYLSGAPSQLPAPLAAHAQSTAEKWKHLRAAGAIGLIGFADPKSSDIPWSRSTLARLNPAMALVEPALIDTTGMQTHIAVNPAHADVFLEGTGHSVEKLLELHRNNAPLPRFPLKFRVRAKTAFSVSPAKSENVIGVLPGSSQEAVVISAHLDHLGVGGAINGDGVYNGAMDNASGIATLIETARALSNKKLKRTILFAAVTGEEGGLMGSKYFAAHPTIPAASIVADVNLDMFLPIIPLKALTVFGMDESDLGQEFAETASKFGVKSERDPEPARNLFIRSDQYSFIRRGIPALTFKFYAASGSPESKVLDAWRHERYHAPSDDLKQPVEVEAAAQFNQIIATFIERIANRPARPQWKPASFFRRYALAD